MCRCGHSDYRHHTPLIGIHLWFKGGSVSHGKCQSCNKCKYFYEGCAPELMEDM